jgi:hypothetical protein
MYLYIYIYIHTSSGASERTSSSVDDVNIVENNLVLGEDSDGFTDTKVEKDFSNDISPDPELITTGRAGGTLDGLIHKNPLPDGFNDMGTNNLNSISISRDDKKNHVFQPRYVY